MHKQSLPLWSEGNYLVVDEGRICFRKRSADQCVACDDEQYDT